MCGPRGAGKTTLLESAIPVLVRRGLAVAAVKHHVHADAISVDREGKDSDRLFRAGADVHLRSRGEAFVRLHGGDQVLAEALASVLADHDLVLVEGHKGTPLPKVWLVGEDEAAAPPGLDNVLSVLARDATRARRFLKLVEEWLPQAWLERPVMAGVLVGGGSTRLGRPKQLLSHGGRTFFETVIAAVSPVVSGVVLLGDGAVPESFGHLPRLADAPGAAGPIAGMLAAMRWAPGAAWLFAACDLPLVTQEAAVWLVSRRAPGRWAVLPDCGKGVEPLLALYEPQARSPLERLVREPDAAPRLLARHPRAVVLTPPEALHGCWRNVNTAADVSDLKRSSPG